MTETTSSKLEVANTILSQLGGSGRLSAMLGAHSFVGDASSLTFRIRAKATNGANCIKVKLDDSDTYTVEFWSIRGARFTRKSDVSDVYADNLRSVIEGTTGLYLSL